MTPIDPERIEHRLDELEMKASFTEDLLDRLNDVIVRQQDQIDLLVMEVKRLKDQTASAGPASPGSLRDELPPHY